MSSVCVKLKARRPHVARQVRSITFVTDCKFHQPGKEWKKSVNKLPNSIKSLSFHFFLVLNRAVSPTWLQDWTKEVLLFPESFKKKRKNPQRDKRTTTHPSPHNLSKINVLKIAFGFLQLNWNLEVNVCVRVQFTSVSHWRDGKMRFVNTESGSPWKRFRSTWSLEMNCRMIHLEVSTWRGPAQMANIKQSTNTKLKIYNITKK